MRYAALLNILVNASKYLTDDMRAYLACRKMVSSESCWVARGCFTRGGFLVQSGRRVDEWAGAYDWGRGFLVRRDWVWVGVKG